MAQDSTRIRAMEPSDWQALADIQAQPKVTWNTLQVPYTSLATAKARYEPEPRNMVRLGAEIDGRMVGVISLSIGSGRRKHVGELGMSVHDDFAGRGVGTAMLAAITEHADKWLGLRRIELHVLTDNARAITLYERHGFVREGVFRDFVFRDGGYVDALAMARINGA